jgi:hypothetical protein
MLWDRIDQSGGPDACWPWTGNRRPDGYGRLGVRGSAYYAHRLAYASTFGPIPDGMLVCHRCDNPSCCNPAHLFVGTDADNQRDAAAKGRKPAGSRHRLAVLTQEQAQAIRASRAAAATLAQDFGVSIRTVYRVRAGETYRGEAA